MNKKNYETPAMDVVEVVAEQFFAQSNGIGDGVGAEDSDGYEN